MKLEVIERILLTLPEDESFVNYFEKSKDYELVNSQNNTKVFEKIKEIVPSIPTEIKSELKSEEKLGKLVVKSRDIKEKSNMEKVINLYANAIGEDLHETKYSAIFCYLHGKIQDENGYDKFSFESKEDAYYFHKNGDACHKVNVIMQNGESRECNFYHWVDSLCRLRGLVVLVDDKDANEYAKKKLEEKPLIL